MISPSDVKVDIPIEGGYVGLVDRDTFDEWLRERARPPARSAAQGRFERLERDADGRRVVVYAAACDGPRGHDNGSSACARAA
jgi:geranylgeranyl reductase